MSGAGRAAEELPQFSYVEQEAGFPDSLICSVCHDPVRTHRSCPGCRNSFCKECMEKWFAQQKRNGQRCSCPYCRKRLRYSQLKHDSSVQSQLDALLGKLQGAASPKVLSKGTQQNYRNIFLSR